MVTTVAPTMPVEAASSAPTITTEIAEPAAQRAEQLAHGREQRLGDPRALEHHAHEDEQRHRHQRLVGHGAEVAAGQRREDRRVEHAERHAERGEQQGDAGQREGHRVAEQHGADRRRRTSPPTGSRRSARCSCGRPPAACLSRRSSVTLSSSSSTIVCPARNSVRRAISARPCRNSSTQNTQSSDLSRYSAGMPSAVLERLADAPRRRHERRGRVRDHREPREQEDQRADDVDPGLAARARSGRTPRRR